MRKYRKAITATITFLAGLYFFLDFVLPEQMPDWLGGFEFGKYNDQILIGVSVVGVMTIGLGLINIFSVHGGRLARMQRGWVNSFALLAGLLLMFVVEGADFINGQRALGAWKRIADFASYAQSIAPEDLPSERRLAILAPLPLLTDESEGLPIAAFRRPFSEVIAAALGRPILDVARVATAQEGVRKLLAELAALRDDLTKGEGFLGEGLVALPEQRRTVLQGIDAASARGLALDRALGNATMGPQLRSLFLAFAEDIKALVLPVREAATAVQEGTLVKKASKLLFTGFYTSLNTAMFALLGFYIAGAAYRSFRLRSMEAGSLMLAAVVVILGQIPHGPLYIYSELPAIRVWLMKNLNTPGNRAIYFASSIAGLALAIRMWLSLERSPLESDPDGGTADGTAAKR